MYHSPLVKWYVCVRMCVCIRVCVCVHVFMHAPIHLSSCECQELLYMNVLCVCVHSLILFLKKSKSQLLKAYLLDLTDTDPDICSTREYQARERIRYGIMYHMTLYIMHHMISYIMHHIMLLLFSYTEGHWSVNTPNICKT